jgi:hypothetical protein
MVGRRGVGRLAGQCRLPLHPQEMHVDRMEDDLRRGRDAPGEIEHLRRDGAAIEQQNVATRRHMPDHLFQRRPERCRQRPDPEPAQRPRIASGAFQAGGRECHVKAGAGENLQIGEGARRAAVLVGRRDAVIDDEDAPAHGG